LVGIEAARLDVKSNKPRQPSHINQATSSKPHQPSYINRTWVAEQQGRHHNAKPTATIGHGLIAMI
jgi:hypothetical protein